MAEEQSDLAERMVVPLQVVDSDNTEWEERFPFRELPIQDCRGNLVLARSSEQPFRLPYLNLLPA